MPTGDGNAVFTEECLLPLSALQHLLFCERQAALIHLEAAWEENALTLQGRHLHKRVEGKLKLSESRSGLRIARGLALRSYVLGLIGKADVVEFHAGPNGDVVLDGAAGRWRVRPVEYKRGKPKKNPCDRVQLCAQALCLEEMLGCWIPEGALFYGKTRHRFAVPLDNTLRSLTVETAARLQAMIAGRVTPPANPSRRCKRCSLAGACMPGVAERDKSGQYLQEHVWGLAP